jgi:GAF domain-containing protein/PilZ domain-containing protein
MMMAAAIGQPPAKCFQTYGSAVNHNLLIERRHSLRQKVNTPAFASFDGVTGGMILDLSEGGMAMQTPAPLEVHSLVPLHVSLAEPAVYLETTGYVAWADALGRAGVRFSDLPAEPRARLREWLSQHASERSWKAPRWIVRERQSGHTGESCNSTGVALSLETDEQNAGAERASSSVQYEFKSLGGNLDAALTLIAMRACSITRGTGAALALANGDGMACRASAGDNIPSIGAHLDANSGFSGECVRVARPLRCDDTQTDTRVHPEVCLQLGIRSILAAPILYEREVVGLLEVFSSGSYAFDDGDLAVVERLAQTTVLTLSRAEAFQQG